MGIIKMQTAKIENLIIQQGILPLYFHKDEEVSLQILETLYKVGIRAIEYTNRGDEALNNFKAMVALRNDKMQEMTLGVGTIKNLDQAITYLNAGADFLVSPGLVAEVAQYCVEHDIFYTPGCMTPTEIIAAENQGIGFIKLFPGNMLKPEFMSSIKDIFPNLKFMPTGGVDTTFENIKSWFDAGVSAVGMGSKLISKKLMEERNFETIASETAKVQEVIKIIKSQIK